MKHKIKQALKCVTPTFYMRHFFKVEDDTGYSKAIRKASRRCKYQRTKVRQYGDLLSNISIDIRPGQRFQSWIDEDYLLENLNRVVCNLPPDYDLVVNHSLAELRAMWQGDGKLRQTELKMLDAVEDYIRRVVDCIDSKSGEGDDQLSFTRDVFERMANHKASTLDEGLQRILFWSSMFWQSGHRLMGLGRLDMVLQGLSYPSEEDAVASISDFMRVLHEHYELKSDAMLGDTGQIILLGGVDRDGNKFENELTHLFIRAMHEVRLPDPKLMLRVTEDTSPDLLKEAVDCISTGIGCPILANDDVMIPALVKFGYDLEDARNYAVSACWEPLVLGRSFEQNNLGAINYAEALYQLLSSDEGQSLSSYEECLQAFLAALERQYASTVSVLDSLRWEPDPLLTLFYRDCAASDKDVSQGGAKYSNFGINNLGMKNAVDSLLNLKHRVFCDEPSLTLQDARASLIANYESHEEEQEILSEDKYFGREDEEAIVLVNLLTRHAQQGLGDYRNRFGGKLKWGHSSSNYLLIGAKTGPTLDGRRASEPLGVHISAPEGVSYTELVMFASRLDCDGQASNGNVVDFFVSPSLIQDNMDRFVRFVQGAILAGFFEMQMNVVSSSTLIEAKKNPEAYPDLIVRVWGFSAYFKDLSDDYQDLLIRRALESERA